jgi:hypothetical protein
MILQAKLYDHYVAVRNDGIMIVLLRSENM